MTRREVAYLLGYNEVVLSYVFSRMSKNHPETLVKAKSYNKFKEIDFTLEECLEAISYLPATMAETRYLKENFIERNSTYKHTKKRDKICPSAYRLIHSMSLFMKSKHQNPQVCANCAYLTRRSTLKAGTKVRPFCTLHEVFMHKIYDKETKKHIDIYADKCDAFLRPENYYTPPLVWDMKGNPIDYVFDGKNLVPTTFKTTLGIDNSQFSTGITKSDEIIILRDAFATDSE